MQKINNCKKKKICLIDVDSSIPNLALMKLSAYFKRYNYIIDLKKFNYSGYKHHKKQIVFFDGSDYDKIFISTIFTCNKNLIKVINCKKVCQGGTGYNYKMKLFKKIEHMLPDYNLYKDNEYSLGFLTRGCIRNCEFCFVPKKEGRLKFHSKLKEFYNPKLPKIMLLDNNFLASPGAVNMLKMLKKTGKKITFKQGLDFRLLTEEKAKHLSELNYDREYIFAFDYIQDKSVIENKMKIWRPLMKDWHTKFFVLVGYNSTLKEDLERVYFLKENKCLPYIMRYETCYTSPNNPFYTDLAAWCNQPRLFKKIPFKEFIKRRHATKKRYNQTMEIIKKNKLNKYLKKL